MHRFLRPTALTAAVALVAASPTPAPPGETLVGWAAGPAVDGPFGAHPTAEDSIDGLRTYDPGMKEAAIAAKALE